MKLEKREAHFERNIAKYTKAGATWCMAQHQDTLNRLTQASKIVDNYITESGIKVNETHFEDGSKQGVIYAGAVEGNFKEALKKYNLKLSWLKIGMVHPLPKERIKEFLEKVGKVLILEELDPLIEAEIMRIAFLMNKKVEILGKYDKTLPLTGNYSFKNIERGIEILLKKKLGAKYNSEIIERVSLAPSGHNTQMCKFLAITNHELLKKMEKAINDKLDRIRKWPEAKEIEKWFERRKKLSIFFVNVSVVFAILTKPYITKMDILLIQHGIGREEIECIRPYVGIQSVAVESFLSLELNMH